MSLWDAGRWDQIEWAGQPPPAEGWGDDWAWWYQPGLTGYPVLNLNEKLVEARWTTDSHTLGDGTFRGDIQPGNLTLRLWDPTHSLDLLDKFGAVWAWYKPTNTVWAWFYDSFTRGLVVPGDPAGADCVYTGTTWPSRMTTPTQFTSYPAQSVAARVAALAASINAQAAYLHLPATTASTAAQSQTVPATAADTSTPLTGYYPSFLAVLRAAAADGVGWLSAGTAGPLGPGALVINYARWETATVRKLDRSQIVAGPPVTASIAWILSMLTWQAVNGSSGAQTAVVLAGPNVQAFGLQGPVALRLWGDVTSGTGAEYNAAVKTGGQVLNDHYDPTKQVLSSVSLQSGSRSTATGGVSPAGWDPHAHIFGPTDVAAIDTAGNSNFTNYRVTKSDHRLTAAVWQTTHYLETYTAATPLP